MLHVTYYLEFVFMTVVPDHPPFSETQPVMHSVVGSMTSMSQPLTFTG